MINDATLMAVMQTNGLTREQAMQAFEISNTKRVALPDAIAEVKGGLPKLPDNPAPALPAAEPTLPDEEPGGLISFANAINQATNIARKKRNESSLAMMAPFRGTVAASDFNGILGAMNRASDSTVADLTKQALDLKKDSDALLSVSEARELGLPFGTTRAEAAKQGIVPRTPKSAEEKASEKETEYKSEFADAEAYVAANPDMDPEILKRNLRKDAKHLSDSDISSIVNSQSASETELKIAAKALVAQLISPAWNSSRSDELEAAKTKAKQVVEANGGVLEINGREVRISQEEWEAIVDAITSDRATANELLELKELQDSLD